MSKVASYLPGKDLRRLVPAFVSRDLWSLLQGMSAEPVLGGTLTDLMTEVEKRLSKRGEFRRSDFKYAQLRIARLATVAP